MQNNAITTLPDKFFSGYGGATLAVSFVNNSIQSLGSIFEGYAVHITKLNCRICTGVVKCIGVASNPS